MFPRGLVNRLVGAIIVAGCALVAVIALGVTLFFLLLMVMPAAPAAAITAAVFAVAALVTALLVQRRNEPDEEEEEPLGLGQRAYQLFMQRPILGTVAALAGGYIFLRNPALATMVAAAFTERSSSTPGRRR